VICWRWYYVVVVSTRADTCRFITVTLSLSLSLYFGSLDSEKKVWEFWYFELSALRLSFFPCWDRQKVLCSCWISKSELIPKLRHCKYKQKIENPFALLLGLFACRENAGIFRKKMRYPILWLSVIIY
jgi:hypothetical protein